MKITFDFQRFIVEKFEFLVPAEILSNFIPAIAKIISVKKVVGMGLNGFIFEKIKC